MASIFKAAGAKRYTILYVDADGRRRKKAGTTDKGTTERIARELESRAALKKEGIIDGRAETLRDHGTTPISEHLRAWRDDMEAKGRSAQHVALSHDRAALLIALARGVAYGSLVGKRGPKFLASAAALLDETLERTRFGDIDAKAIQAGLKSIVAAGRSPQSANHFRAALRSFYRWCRAHGRIRDLPTEVVSGFNVDADRRHVRRALASEELARLIAHAQGAGPMLGMPGPLRAMAYAAAASLGFRVDELRSLAPEAFHLDGPRPFVRLSAAAAKNGRAVDQPCPSSLVGPLREFLEGKPAGASVFPLHHDTAKAIRTDLERCGVPYETDDGRADFHALRAFYITSLIKAGRSIKEVQRLARHSKPETTLKFYAKASIHDLYEAAETLPAVFGATGNATKASADGFKSLSA